MPWLGLLDTPAMTAWCLLTAAMERSPANFSAAKHRRLERLEIQLGIDPAGRAKREQAMPPARTKADEYFDGDE